MAQNITLLGASYSDVPGVTLPKTGGGTALFTDVTDTTAAAADVASGKYFYTAAGVLTQGTASGGGGASNVVTGTFTGTTANAAMDVTLNYSGTGYPVAVVVYPKEGPYNKSAGDGSFYTLVKRYAFSEFLAVKSNVSDPPTYSGSSTHDMMTYVEIYKNSTSDATTYSRAYGLANEFYNDIDASTNYTYAPVKIRSKTKMSVFIQGVSYGFPPNIEYTYWVLYSS